MLSLIALVAVAVALVYTEKGSVLDQPSDKKVKNRPPSHDVRALVYSDERIKAV